jgi:hypothetical protein
MRAGKTARHESRIRLSCPDLERVYAQQLICFVSVQPVLAIVCTATFMLRGGLAFIVKTGTGCCITRLSCYYIISSFFEGMYSPPYGRAALQQESRTLPARLALLPSALLALCGHDLPSLSTSSVSRVRPYVPVHSGLPPPSLPLDRIPVPSNCRAVKLMSSAAGASPANMRVRAQHILVKVTTPHTYNLFIICALHVHDHSDATL